MKIQEVIMIVGGCGVVGQQAARIIRQRHPDLPLIIADRNSEKAKTLASELGNADIVVLDVEQPNPLNGMAPRAILSVVNDSRDYLLMDAVRTKVPYVDITRWTERLKSAVSLVSKESLHSPVILSSAWMAGVAAVIAVAASRQLRRVDSIDIFVLYSLKDKAGPNSTEYMDRMTVPFNVMQNGKQKQVYPYTEPRKVTFPGGYSAKTYRFDTPDQFTLPSTTGAQTVSARIAFDDTMAMNLLVLLTRFGIWKLISGKLFTPLRRKLLYNPGSGANHEIVIEVAGVDKNSNPKTIRATVVDSKGQTHLAAVGAVLQLERLLGLDGALAPAAGIIYPDTAPQVDFILQALSNLGIDVVFK